MLYKKQMKRLTRKAIEKNRERHNVQPNEITPIIEKAFRKARRNRIGNGQVLMSRSEWRETVKDEWIIVAEECLNDEVWVIKRKK